MIRQKIKEENKFELALHQLEFQCIERHNTEKDEATRSESYFYEIFIEEYKTWISIVRSKIKSVDCHHEIS